MHLKLLLLTPIVLLSLIHTPIAIAQITPATDGTGTTIVTQGNQFDITGGTRSSDGANLFHSFQQFGLNPGQVANFLSTPGTQNILGRVIGGQASLINGPIQITGGLSHLYLLNPAGIVFGANASLNVPGSFTATTANGIRFSDQWWGIATHPAQFSSLTGTPTGFGFGDNAAGTIFNAGQLRSAQGIALLGGQVINPSPYRAATSRSPQCKARNSSASAKRGVS
jgi:filamentous hemagglutinin family protein